MRSRHRDKFVTATGKYLADKLHVIAVQLVCLGVLWYVSSF